MDLERVYLKLPISLQNMGCSLHGLRLRLSRYNSRFHGLLREAEERTFWPPERIIEFRHRRLADYVKHCAETIPFYRKRFRGIGLDPASIKCLEDLGNIPITSKEEIQDHYQEMLSDAVDRRRCLIAHTSGTTGGGLRFALTPEAYREQWCIWWRYRRWHRVDLGTWCGYFGGRSVVPLSQKSPPFWRYDYVGRQILFSGYHMSPETLVSYVEELRRRRPEWLNGYPSLLALLATYLVETGGSLGYQPRLVTTLAESLLPHQSLLIEKAFGVRPKQHYGMAEGVANISECPQGRLHVDEDFSAVEFLPTSDPAVYRLVGTSFSNLALGFLRYDIQDLARLSQEECDCGRPGRVVEAIDGRREDYVILKNGARIGRMDHIFKDLVNIREAQIYQQTPGVVIFRVVPGRYYNGRDESLLRAEGAKRLGQDTEIIVDYVSSISRGPTGKLRFVLSDIPEAKIF